MTTAAEIGKWLFEVIQTNGPKRSYQSVLVRRIRTDFGEEFSYRNRNGNWAIDKAVLKAFNELRDDHIYWDRSDQSWRVLTDEQLSRVQERAERRAAAREAALARRRAREEGQAVSDQ